MCRARFSFYNFFKRNIDYIITSVFHHHITVENFKHIYTFLTSWSTNQHPRFTLESYCTIRLVTEVTIKHIILVMRSWTLWGHKRHNDFYKTKEGKNTYFLIFIWKYKRYFKKIHSQCRNICKY